MIDITAQLILDDLSQKWSIQLFGQKPTGGLKMPKFYNPDITVESWRVYVTSPEYLPAEPNIPKDALLICVRGQPSWRYTRGRFPMVGVACNDIWEVFNAIQDVFDRYNCWACELDSIVEGNADIISMVRISLPILENPLAVLDREMYHLALTDGYEEKPQDISAWTVHQSPPIEPNYLVQYKEKFNDYLTLHDIYSAYSGSYTINLFLSGRREGLVTVGSKHRPFRESDFTLFRFFAGKVEKAMARHAVLSASHANSLKTVFQELLAQKPVSNNRMHQIKSRYQISDEQHFMCIVLRMPEDNADLPVEYLCASLERVLPGCVAMDADDGLVAVLCLQNDAGMTKQMRQDLEEFLQETGFQAGISYVFSRIRSIHTYYRQACSAYEMGIEIHPEGRCYMFREYVLPYMLLNCVGEYSAYALCPRELLRLRDKSKTSGVDYWETLQVFLDNNMNVAKTARDLYLHRSSLLARLDRIKDILGTDLDDPSIQLEYRLIMTLLRLENRN